MEQLWPEGTPKWAESYACGRPLDGDRWLVVIPLTFGRGRVAICTEDNACIEAY